MMSKIVKNLFICGEAVDLCGECGGFNLHLHLPAELLQEKIYDQSEQYTFKP